MCQFKDSVFNSIKAIVDFESLSQQRVPQTTDNLTYTGLYALYGKIKQFEDLIQGRTEQSAAKIQNSLITL